MDCKPHPLTGHRYYVVIPTAWGPHTDLLNSYLEFSTRHPWLVVVSPEHFMSAWETLRRDPTAFVVLWDTIPVNEHDCTVALVFFEAYDQDNSKLLPEHKQHLDYVKSIASHYDLIFAHTPWMASELKQVFGRPTKVLPHGWSPRAWGSPRVLTPRTSTVVTWGSPAGRRRTVFPVLANLLGEFKDISGTYGRALHGQLDQSATALYVAHSLVRSYSTWRLWQCLTAGVGLISEPGDTWPFEANHHYLEIPHITLANSSSVATDIKAMLQDRTLLQRTTSNAFAAFHSLFNLDTVIQHYLVDQ